MQISRRILGALWTTVILSGALPAIALADEPNGAPAPPPPPPFAGASGGSGDFSAAPTGVVPPLSVTLSAESGLPSGKPGILTIRAVDSRGNPAGGFAAVIVRFPLAPDNSAYWTDLVLLVPISEEGHGAATITIPAVVPTGTPITIEAHAILPPHLARGELKLNVG
ncbi:MAG: hypothetical protein RMM58_14195 [Chloroflexota bacterium]|nr:hypothetical protein [Dehalococcoidia bacterium]MDW8255023.1 hypothetical protein [Chloroflexota bacterium]